MSKLFDSPGKTVSKKDDPSVVRIDFDVNEMGARKSWLNRINARHSDSLTIKHVGKGG